MMDDKALAERAQRISNLSHDPAICTGPAQLHECTLVYEILAALREVADVARREAEAKLAEAQARAQRFHETIMSELEVRKRLEAELAALRGEGEK